MKVEIDGKAEKMKKFKGRDEIFETLPTECNFEDDFDTNVDDSIDKFHQCRPKEIKSLKRNGRRFEKTDSVGHKKLKVGHKAHIQVQNIFMLQLTLIMHIIWTG